MELEKVDSQALQAQKVPGELQESDLTEEEKKQVEDIKKEIDFDDTNSIIQFGVSAQSGISNFSDTILGEIKTKDTGYVGEMLSELLVEVKSLKVGNLSTGESVMSKIPIISSFVKSAKKFVVSYEKVSINIEKIVDELTKARMQLLKDITLFDTLYEKNLQYLKQLDLFILAGKMKIKELQDTVIPEAKKQADASGDTLDAQKVQDLVQMLNRLEKKIHDLQLSRMVSLQTNPQVRLIQGGDQVLVEKIQSSILNTIPLWKNQIIIAIGLFRQQKALELQKEVSDTTNDLLKKNAEMLKDGTIGVAKESERGIVEIETLKKVHDDLVTTIEETMKIQQEGRTKRQQAEVELSKIETDLKNKLKEIKSAPPAEGASL